MTTISEFHKNRKATLAMLDRKGYLPRRPTRVDLYSSNSTLPLVALAADKIRSLRSATKIALPLALGTQRSGRR